MMLASENRLKKEKRFKRVLRGGTGRKGRFLVLKVRNKEEAEPRFGFVVSKKVCSKAVTRNKVKRRLREAVRSLLPEVEQGVDCVFIALPGIEKADWEEIKGEVASLLERAEVLRKE